MPDTEQHNGSAMVILKKKDRFSQVRFFMDNLKKLFKVDDITDSNKLLQQLKTQVPVTARGRFTNTVTGNLDGCRGHDNDYGKLINNLFEQVENAGCSSHQQLWTTLYHISDYGSYDCMGDMIYRAVERYQDAAHDPCVCEETTTTPKTTTTTTPTTTTTTTTKPTTSSTTTSTTTTSTTTIPTTTAPVFKHTCDPHKVITILAHAQIVTHPDAHPCSDVQVGTNEDLVLNACNLTAPTTWTRGVNVGSIYSNSNLFSPLTIL
ncbi:ELMO domain-containing protein C-like [Mya arenaria]|uniref:ELMO domain-containing protein C-like n=1 Tax=Mya arenaria TaxID=6604 RepID=UPI0022E73F1C|nr:ELMO domain-containing protein C-like [Mya arenaria]